MVLWRRVSTATSAHLEHEVDDERGRVLHVRLDVRQHLAQRSRSAACAAMQTNELSGNAFGLQAGMHAPLSQVDTG